MKTLRMKNVEREINIERKEQRERKREYIKLDSTKKNLFAQTFKCFLFDKIKNIKYEITDND